MSLLHPLAYHSREAQPHNKPGWADDIVAPRQEVDMLSLLQETSGLQRAMKARDMTPDGFLDAYAELRNAYRQGLGERPKDIDDLLSRVTLFGAQAAARARRGSSQRAFLTCDCPDRPGVLAALAEQIADEGGNIIGGVMAVVAGHLVTALMVSDWERGDQAIVQEQIGEKLVDSTPIEVDDVRWPRPGSNCWHLVARFRGEESLLEELTDVIRLQRAPVVALSSWVETGQEVVGDGDIQVVDLNFALAPRNKHEESRAVTHIVGDVKQRLGGVQVQVAPVPVPVHYRPRMSAPASAADKLIVTTILGRARPGFVHRAIRTIGEVGAVRPVKCASMALLEGDTVLTVAIDTATSMQSDDDRAEIQRLIAARLRSSLRTKGQRRLIALHFGVPSSSQSADGDDQQLPTQQLPTHRLRVRAREQPRVIAKLARMLKDEGANITWFASQVREPVIGDVWPICDTQMQVHVKDGKNDIEQRLSALANAEGWQRAWAQE
jgi:glycine cleavage system regulatory protein